MCCKLKRIPHNLVYLSFDVGMIINQNKSATHDAESVECAGGCIFSRLADDPPLTANLYVALCLIS